MSEENPENDEAHERMASILTQALATAMNESGVLGRLEEFFDPKPARLATTQEDAAALNDRIDKVVIALGGAPRLLIQWKDKPLPRYDEYCAAAIHEALALFDRARTAVTRAHMFYIAIEMDKKFPDVLQPPSDDKAQAFFRKHLHSSFWEHTETALIRIAAYWDRIGQILDFAFFRIRQYEHDGYSGVMDRIHNNWVKVDEQLRQMSSWDVMRRYQTSEQTSGLKWLLRRRNLLVHSLHLRPLADSEEDEPLFESAFNHLDDAVKRKLATGTMAEELARLHDHLSIAANQFIHVLSVAERGAELTALKGA